MGWLGSDDFLMPWALSIVGEVFATLPQMEWLTTLFPMECDERVGQFSPTTSTRTAQRRSFAARTCLLRAGQQRVLSSRRRRTGGARSGSALGVDLMSRSNSQPTSNSGRASIDREPSSTAYRFRWLAFGATATRNLKPTFPATSRKRAQCCCAMAGGRRLTTTGHSCDGCLYGFCPDVLGAWSFQRSWSSGRPRGRAGRADRLSRVARTRATRSRERRGVEGARAVLVVAEQDVRVEPVVDERDEPAGPGVERRRRRRPSGAAAGRGMGRSGGCRAASRARRGPWCTARRPRREGRRTSRRRATTGAAPRARAGSIAGQAASSPASLSSWRLTSPGTRNSTAPSRSPNVGSVSVSHGTDVGRVGRTAPGRSRRAAP